MSGWPIQEGAPDELDSHAELAQMMIEMPMNEPAPAAATHPTKHRMVGPGTPVALFHKTLDEAQEDGEIVVPGGRLSHEGLRWALDPPLGPGEPVHHELFDEGKARRTGSRRGRRIAEGMSHLVTEMRQHARRAQAAPTWFGLRGEAPKSIEESLSIF